MESNNKSHWFGMKVGYIASMVCHMDSIWTLYSCINTALKTGSVVQQDGDDTTHAPCFADILHGHQTSKAHIVQDKRRSRSAVCTVGA